MIKNNFFVVTGGPGAGKTTLLNALKKEGYAGVDETARAIIKGRLQLGLTPRPSAKEFTVLLFQLDVANYQRQIAEKKLLFFDRSFLDSAAMLNEISGNDQENINGILKTHRFNNIVFMAPPWKEIYHNDEERDQTFRQSIAVYEKLYAWYKKYDYNLLILPKDTVVKRVEFICKEIGK